MRNKLNIQKIEQFYTISQDGRIWSKLKNRWMKPIQNNLGYLHTYITKGVERPLWVFNHTLVALKYIGEPPTDKHEIDHKDNNRANNQSINLEWVTKSENHLRAYKNGKDHHWLNKHRPSPGVETLMLMADAKKKKILYKSATQTIIYNSIEEAASQLNTYRKKIYNCICDNKPIQGGFLSYYNDISNTMDA
jgi:hypothetical protein